MEQAEFEHIAIRIRQRAVATALTFAANGDEAEDIAQETMLKLWTLRTEISDRAHAEKLASCIAHNRAIDSTRRRRTIPLDTGRRRTIPLDTGRSIIDDKTASPDRAIEDKENMAWLTERLASLPSTEYQILRLRQVERKSHEEIARIVGVEKTSVSTILARARAKMLNEFKKRER